MDARELTKCMFEQQNKTIDHEKRIAYLEQEVVKLRRFIDDIKIDIEMMQGSEQARWRDGK